MKKSIMITSFILLVLAGLSVSVIPPVAEAAPTLINYQGVLGDNAGIPVPDGNFAMTFRIYDDAASVDPLHLLYEETQTVAVTGGVYNVLLGSGTPTVGTFDVSLFSGDNRWLEVEVNTERLTPRQQIVSVAYALQAQKSATAIQATTVVNNAITTSMINDNAVTGTKILNNTITSDKIVDGSGSNLNADLLDGMDSSAFMAAGTDLWVNTTGDTMTGSLNLPANGLVVGGTQFLVGSSGVGIGTATPTHALHVVNDVDQVMRLEGPGVNGSEARLIFGDPDFVYLYEDFDDTLEIFADGRTAITGGFVGIGTLNPTERLTVSGDARILGVLHPDGGISTSSGISIQSLGGNVVITAGSSVVTVSPTGGVTISSSQVDVTATGDINLTGNNVKVTSTGGVIDLNGTTF